MENKTKNQLKNLVAFNAALNELKQKVICYRYQKVKICLDLYDKIETLKDEQEKRLLKYRYIRGYTWDVIADKMGYSVRQVFNIHRKVIYKIEENK